MWHGAFGSGVAGKVRLVIPWYVLSRKVMAGGVGSGVASWVAAG